MILDLIVQAALLVFGGLIGLFPAYQLPGEFTSFGYSAGSGLAAANGVFPVVTLGVCIAAVLLLQLFLAALDLIVWVYDKVPFKAT